MTNHDGDGEKGEEAFLKENFRRRIYWKRDRG